MEKQDYRMLKMRAIELRKGGLSYNEIRRRINISKSTLSYWLKTVSLTQEHKARLYTKQIQILSRGPQSQQERRASEIALILESAEKEIQWPLLYETHRLMGAGLYWAEGSKRGSKGFEITNSDPYFILFMVRWLKKIFGIPPHILRARLNIYPQQNEDEIKRFWSALTEIPLHRFGKSYVKPLSTGYKKNNLYYGTMRLEVPKSSDLKYRILGWINGALRDICPTTKPTLERWRSLTSVRRPVNLG